MIQQNEKVYMFNPFNLKNWKNKQIKEQLDVLIDKYDYEADTMAGLAINAENLANQLYIIGEMIARLTEEVYVLKAEVKNEESITVYKERKAWEVEHDGKVPAIAYFEAVASNKTKDSRMVLAKKESDLKRFKIAYESIEAKMNAVKKRMDSIRYEEFGS